MQKKLLNWMQWLKPSRIGIHEEYTSAKDTLQAMSRFLTENLDVAEGFSDALVRREQEYPTGLPTEPFGVAIPHADGRYVLRPGLVVWTMKTPVLFREMGNPQNQVMVKLVLLIALPGANQDGQTEILQGIAGLIQTPGFLQDVDGCRDADQLLNVFTRYYNEGSF